MTNDRAESLWSIFRHYGGAVLIAVVIALGIRFFVLEAYRIPSSAMKPLLEPGDTIFVSKWDYGLRWPGSSAPFTRGRAPQRGEVVVFSRPDEPGLDYVKRIVALEGDVVALRRGQVYVNQVSLAKVTPRGAVCAHEKLGKTTYPVCWEPPVLDDVAPVKVPAGQVFVIGDWRTKPQESFPGQAGTFLQSGLIPVGAIKGRALWIWLSVEPPGGEKANLFSRIRFERMFQRLQ